MDFRKHLENPRSSFHLRILNNICRDPSSLRGNACWFQGLAPGTLGGIFVLLQLIFQKHTSIIPYLDTQIRIKLEFTRSLGTPFRPQSAPPPPTPPPPRPTVLWALWLLMFYCQGLGTGLFSSFKALLRCHLHWEAASNHPISPPSPSLPLPFPPSILLHVKSLSSPKRNFFQSCEHFITHKTLKRLCGMARILEYNY